MRATVWNPERHLTIDELSDPHPECGFCGSVRRLPSLVLQEEPLVRLLRCLTCGACSASRTPRALARGELRAVAHPERFARYLLERGWPVTQVEEFRILEFGGGEGTLGLELARLVRAAGAPNVTLLSIGEEAHPPPAADPRITVVTAGSLAEWAGPPVDYVVASSGLERVAEPRAVLLRLLEALKPAGVFYARTPTVVEFPAQLHDLGQAFWDGALDTLGLSGYRLRRSAPALVESSFSSAPGRSAAAWLAKVPWWLLGQRYALGGGWEVFIDRE